MSSSSVYPRACAAMHIYLLSVLLLLREVHFNDAKEFCQYEVFEASCSHDEVIVMTSAQYGRMKIGRCVKSDFGFLDCSYDVLALMDRKCSGRQRCQVKVVDPTFNNIHPCNEEFKSYLDTSYECVKVLRSKEFLCPKEGSRLELPSVGYVSNAHAAMECGGHNSPYRMQLPHGQTLNLSLIDFHLPLRADPTLTSSTGRCDVYATIREPSSTRSESICGGQAREKSVFITTSNTIEIYMNDNMADGSRYFLLKYHVLGCPDIEPGQVGLHAWVKREGNYTRIGCNTSQQVWRLECQGTSWSGHVGNCSVGPPEETTSSEVVVDVMSLPTGMLVAIVIGIACIISFSILLLGIYYLRRSRSRPRQVAQKTATSGTNPSEEYIIQTASSTYSRPESTYVTQRPACPICARQRDPLGSCDYAYTWSDSPTMQARRAKDKIYSPGIYAPIPCRCVPIKMREINTREGESQGTISPADPVLRSDTSNTGYVYIESNPDVVNTLRTDLGHENRGGTTTFKSDGYANDQKPSSLQTFKSS